MNGARDRLRIKKTFARENEWHGQVSHVIRDTGAGAEKRHGDHKLIGREGIDLDQLTAPAA